MNARIDHLIDEALALEPNERSAIAEDLDGDLVFLARNGFNLDYTGQQSPGIEFKDVKDVQADRKNATA